MSKLRFIVTLGVLCALSVEGEQQTPAAQAENELRHRLERIARNCPTRFRELEGVRVDIRPGDVSWYEGNVYLPGATTCRVYRTPKSTYECEWTKPERGGTLTALHADLTRRIDAALSPANWRRVETEQPKSTRFDKTVIVLGQVFVVVLPPGGREPTVKVIVECESRH